MSVYRGTRLWTGVLVTKDGFPLSPVRSQELWNHSPTGFEWGYGGSGPAQLALAILAEELGEEEACRCYQAFKWDVIARLPHGDWEMTSDDVLAWYAKHVQDEAAV